MKKLSLQIRITIVSALVLIGIAAILTIVAVNNAKTTYTNQFELNFGNGVSFQYNDNGFSYDGEAADFVNGILGFVNGYIKEDNSGGNSEQGFFSEAGRQFTQESLGFMIFLVAIGIIITFFLVKRALSPVRQLSLTIKEINENNLFKKLEVPPAKDEISSLTCSFNDMLERLDKSFTSQRNFAANAAHELRTPLSTMKAGIQVLEMDEEPQLDDYKETFEVIKNSTERMIKVIDDLLELSRSDQGDFTNRIDLNLLLHEVEQELSEKAKALKVTLLVGRCEGYLQGNETLLYRAIFNIVENALKYNREGGYVQMSCERQESQIKILISDNGIGISKDALVHIFEPFYRADKSRSRAVGGSGLGLAIVKGIIERHKGKIYVNSSEGEGSTFEILLPGVY